MAQEERNRLVRALAHFVPEGEWFGALEQSKAVVKVFRVHRVPFDDFPRYPEAKVMDLGLVRAVFLRGSLLLPYHELLPQLYPTPDGGVELKAETWISVPSLPEDAEIMRPTGEGLLLLLITPSVVDGEDVAEDAVRENLELARAVIVAVLGRNAAFEELFSAELAYARSEEGEVYPAEATYKSLIRDNPMAFAPPTLDDPSTNLVRHVVENIESLDEEDRNRVSLALRWYQRIQGRRATETESDVDGFLSLWVALEVLVAPENPIGSVTSILASIHTDLSFQQIGELFPIGRIFGLRGKILHHGKTPYLEGRLLRFMSAVLVDVLVYKLNLSSTPRTSVYRDGSAREAVRVSEQSM